MPTKAKQDLIVSFLLALYTGSHVYTVFFICIMGSQLPTGTLFLGIIRLTGTYNNKQCYPPFYTNFLINNLMLKMNNIVPLRSVVIKTRQTDTQRQYKKQLRAELTFGFIFHAHV